MLRRTVVINYVVDVKGKYYKVSYFVRMTDVFGKLIDLMDKKIFCFLPITYDSFLRKVYLHLEKSKCCTRLV